jgi:hypothetical protein
MSNDAAIVERVLREVMGRCRFCGCAGDSCSVPWGGKCELVGQLQAVCNAPACARAAAFEKKDEQRAAERKAARLKREAEIPQWMRVRREETARFRKTKKRAKTKGRAA